MSYQQELLENTILILKELDDLYLDFLGKEMQINPKPNLYSVSKQVADTLAKDYPSLRLAILEHFNITIANNFSPKQIRGEVDEEV